MSALARIVPDDEECPSTAGPALRGDLLALIARIDASFNIASEQLGHSASKIETIVAALSEVASMFDGGVGAEAVDGLKQAAASLMTIQSVVDQRSTEISTMHEAARALRGSAQDVLRCLQVLDVYGLNVKITASGLQQFMDFADAMRLKLGQGSQELRGLDQMLEALDKSLEQMSQTDRMLITECAQVIPQVPESLLREAGNLEAHHAGLTDLAQSIAVVARSIQTELYAAIQAIQIGDRVRQRLEHLLAGLAMINQHSSDGSLGDGTSDRFHAVLAALCDAAADEYRRDITDLVASLGRLQGQCDRLADLHRAQEGGGDGNMLERIEASVADAHEMLQQLDRADSEGLATLTMILRTVDEVAERAKAIALLRLDVQHMAINIGLNCRSAAQIGRPVMVIANEIRSYSARLDAIADTINAEQVSLSNPCHRISERSREHKHASSEVLLRFIQVIGDCSQDSKRAAAKVEGETVAMQCVLASAIGALDDAAHYSTELHAVSARLHLRGLALQPADEGEAVILQTMLDALARTYTMVEEREVHNAHLPPGLTGIASVQAPPQGVDDDEDDGLF